MGSLKDSSHTICLVNSIHKLYENKLLCDVTLQAMDGCEIEAHWLILAAHSQFFLSLHGNQKTEAVPLAADSETLRNILDYLYTGSVKITDSNRKQLLDTGQLLQLDAFVKFLTERQEACNTNVTDSEMSTMTEIPSNPFHRSTYLPESHQDEDDFDINRVKDESDGEDAVSSNLQVTFSTATTLECSDIADMSQMTEHQFVSPLMKQLHAPVQMGQIVPNIAGQQNENILSYSQGVPEESTTVSSSCNSPLSSVTVTDNSICSKRRKMSRAASPKVRSPRRVQCGQEYTHITQESSASLDRGVRQVSHTEERLRESKNRYMNRSKHKRHSAGRKRHSRKSSMKSVSYSLKKESSNCTDKHSKGSDSKEEAVEFMEEPREDQDDRVPPIPGALGSEGEEEDYLASSFNKKKKTQKGNKAEKKLKSGNFLTRWNKTSICSLCGFEGRISAVVLHKKSVHPEDAHVCPLCFNRSVDYNAMVQHLKRQHLWRESGKYRCRKCGRDCHNRVGLLSHDQISHGVKHAEVLVCETEGCNFYCASQSPATMEEHRKGHGDMFDYACDRCDKKYRTKKALKNHMYQHINSQRYQCEVCGYFTATPSDLKLHTTTNHSHGPLYKCHVCGNNYRSQYSMDDHLWKVHGEKDEKRKCLQCDECDFITLWQGTLTAHKKIHVTEKNFACEICGKIFRTPNNLSSHRNSTHKECDLHCNFTFCQHTTKTLDHMRKHLMIAHYYKGVKPYSCVYCQYKSMTGGNVRKHVVVQHPTEEVKYVPDRELLAQMKAKWLALDKSQWTDILRNK